MLLLSLLVATEEAGAFRIENGDFELGDLTGWTVFTTPNGSLGGNGFPRCTDFDIAADGHLSKSAEFKVGQQKYVTGGPRLAGGGILTKVRLEAGLVVISVDIAASYVSPNDDQRNLAGGLLELILDGDVIASHDFGPILNHSNQHATLQGSSRIDAGMHELKIRIQRPFRSLEYDVSPHQYLDNILIHHSVL